jgi:UPF0271 protein
MLLNADLGESWYDRRVGNDGALMPYLDHCNIACGFHGGDALTLQRTARLALQHGVAIGAHPSFPDRRNFGRRHMDLDADRLYALIVYQVGGLREIVRDAGGTLHHLKAHGALYHAAERSEATAGVICTVVTRLGIPYLVGPPDGLLEQLARDRFIAYLREGFADRVYEPTLHLRPRNKKTARLDTREEVRNQARLLLAGQVRASDGQLHPLRVDTLCLHGDHPGAAERAAAVRELIPPR